MRLIDKLSLENERHFLSEVATTHSSPSLKEFGAFEGWLQIRLHMIEGDTGIGSD